MKTYGAIPQYFLSMVAMADCIFFKFLPLSLKRSQFCKMSVNLNKPMLSSNIIFINLKKI